MARKQFMKKNILFARGLAILVIAAVLMQAFRGKSVAEDDSLKEITITVEFNQTEARKMLDLINEFRTGPDAWALNEEGEKEYYEDLKPLVYDYNLEKIAMERAMDCATAFAHKRPDGSSWVMAIDGTISYCECLARAAADIYNAVKMWREDNQPFEEQGHRRAMLSSVYTSIGIGFCTVEGLPLYVLEFGFENSNAPETPPVNGTVTRTQMVDTSQFNQPGGLIDCEGSITMRIGETMDLPGAKFYMLHPRASRESSSTLVSSDKYDPIWKIGESNKAVIEDGKIVALHAGLAHLEVHFFCHQDGVTYPSQSIVEIKILQDDISEAEMHWREVDDWGYVHPQNYYTWRGRELKFGEDFVYVLEDYSFDSWDGTVTEGIEGVGDFYGTKQFSYSYKEYDPSFRPNNERIDISSGTVAPIPDQVYTGKEICPKITFTFEGKTLEEGKDFVVAYIGGTNVGIGVANGSIGGSGDYIGNVEFSFNIVAGENKTPTKAPTAVPTKQPTPTADPTQQPTPTLGPTMQPTATVVPTGEVTPTLEPDLSLTPEPTEEVSPSVTVSPTPTIIPSPSPSCTPIPSGITTPTPVVDEVNIEASPSVIPSSAEQNHEKTNVIRDYMGVTIICVAFVMVVILTVIAFIVRKRKDREEET